MSEVVYALDRDSGVATLIIDTAGPVNSIGQAFLADLERAIVRAGADQAKGVILTSGKKKSFLDGANL
jgi:3-hydroxyacyl-CoA dehydrogenase / enoyl-CoA hydratase / 3-hydroxybutyryl-CoA epimerase